MLCLLLFCVPCVCSAASCGCPWVCPVGVPLCVPLVCRLPRTDFMQVWQPSSEGVYSIDADGDCRAHAVTDADGAYAFATHVPGTYGITGGRGLFGFEVPPYSMRHIHIAVFARGFARFTTQLTFAEDVARGADFREVLAPGCKLSDPSLELGLRWLNNGSRAASFDFVLQAHVNPEHDPDELAQFQKDVCVLPFDFGQPFAICNPKLLEYVSVDTIMCLPCMMFYVLPLGTVVAVCAIFSWLLRKCCRRVPKKQEKTD